MKFPFKTVLISAVATVSAFASITYTSCNRDKCKTITCANGGVCNEGRCICPSGFEGSNCETVTRNKFLGNWFVYEKGSMTNAAQYPISIKPAGEASDPPLDVVITNFNNYFLTPIKAYVTGDTLIIPNQQYEGKVVHGIGYIHSSNTYVQFGGITMRYQVIDTATQNVNDYGYNEPVNHSKPSEWNK